MKFQPVPAFSRPALIFWQVADAGEVEDSLHRRQPARVFQRTTARRSAILPTPPVMAARIIFDRTDGTGSRAKASSPEKKSCLIGKRRDRCGHSASPTPVVVPTSPADGIRAESYPPPLLRRCHILHFGMEAAKCGRDMDVEARLTGQALEAASLCLVVYHGPLPANHLSTIPLSESASGIHVFHECVIRSDDPVPHI